VERHPLKPAAALPSAFPFRSEAKESASFAPEPLQQKGKPFRRDNKRGDTVPPQRQSHAANNISSLES
jgi:hypothetical protein